MNLNLGSWGGGGGAIKFSRGMRLRATASFPALQIGMTGGISIIIPLDWL